jgi:hypothetical protein
MIHELFAYLSVRNAAEAIDFYIKAFGVKEKFRLTEPSGRIGHAELDFNGATLMLADEFPEYGFNGPQTIGNTTVTCTSTTRMKSSGVPLKPAPNWRENHKTSFTASAQGPSAIRSVTGGTSGTASRRSRRLRCSGVTRI